MKKNTKQNIAIFFTSPRWAYVGSFVLSVLLVFAAFRLQHRLEHFRSLGLLGIFLINVVASSTLFLPAPAIALSVAGGVVYPPYLVAIVAAAGASLGDMLAYILGRSGKHVVLNHTEHVWYMYLKKIFSKFAAIIIFLFALIPNPFFDAIGILAGATEYPPVRFFGIMFVGRFLRNMALALIGARL